MRDTRDILVHVLRASTLLFSIPSVVVSIPPLPVPLAVRRVCKFDLSKVTLIFVVILLSLAPPPLAATLNDLTLLLALAGTYFLPGMCIQEFPSSVAILTHARSLCSHSYTLLPTASVHRDTFSLGPEHSSQFTHTFSD